MKDLKLDTFDIVCKKCKSLNCKTYRDFYPEMRGECKVVCLECGNTEFCMKGGEDDN